MTQKKPPGYIASLINPRRYNDVPQPLPPTYNESQKIEEDLRNAPPSYESSAQESNKALISDPEFRQALFQQFAPTFFFHKQEQSFPIHPDDFVKNIIEVKHDEYTNIQQRQKRDLTEVEKGELDVINEYFWKDGKFNPNYKERQNEDAFQKVVNKRDENGKDPQLLVFDEKKYGYKVGSKIDIVGVAPKGHPNYNPDKKAAPYNASIIPTKEGFYIQYECTYALNDAIKGTRWLRDLLPSKIANKADNFGLHYGDCEGVGVYIKVDGNGKASLDAMQTFAHGTKGARRVDTKDCTFKNERPCVFVGLGGHPSYADNFVGRNKFMDVVGDAYKITPNKFYDVSPDIIALANGHTSKENSDPNLVKVANELPAGCSTFSRLADSNPISWDGPKNEQEIEKNATKWNQYNPSLVLTKAWHKIKSSVKGLFGHKEESQKTTPVLDIKQCQQRLKESKNHEVSQGVSPNVSKSWAKEVGTQEQRQAQGTQPVTR